MKKILLFVSLILVSILFISGCETQFSGRSCSIESCDSQACLEIQNVDTTDNTLDVCINNSLNLGGFQFEVLGVEITGAGGGISDEYAWMVSNSPSTVLGFTLSGNYILQGEGILTMVSFNNPGDEICFGEDTGSAGLTTLSDSGGGYVNSVDWGDCYCTTDEDCFGVCDGTAVLSGCDNKCGSTLANDECGVCGGNGMQVSYSEDCSYEYQCNWEYIIVPIYQCASGSCYSGSCYSHSDCRYTGTATCHNNSYCIFEEEEYTEICEYIEVCESTETYFCP